MILHEESGPNDTADRLRTTDEMTVAASATDHKSTTSDDILSQTSRASSRASNLCSSYDCSEERCLTHLCPNSNDHRTLQWQAESSPGFTGQWYNRTGHLYLQQLFPFPASVLSDYIDFDQGHAFCDDRCRSPTTSYTRL
jgi:hypothetical protein